MSAERGEADMEGGSRLGRVVLGMAEKFRVPDRGSGNPTPLGGVGLRHYPCRLRGWKRTNVAATLLGLQVPSGLGDEVPLSGAWRGCWEPMPGAASGNGTSA